jgi:hypothetical protein
VTKFNIEHASKLAAAAGGGVEEEKRALQEQVIDRAHMLSRTFSIENTFYREHILWRTQT